MYMSANAASTATSPTGAPAVPIGPAAPHTLIEPGILYFGTPVVLISTLNEDGSASDWPV